MALQRRFLQAATDDDEHYVCLRYSTLIGRREDSNHSRITCLAFLCAQRGNPDTAIEPRPRPCTSTKRVKTAMLSAIHAQERGIKVATEMRSASALALPAATSKPIGAMPNVRNPRSHF